MRYFKDSAGKIFAYSDEQIFKKLDDGSDGFSPTEANINSYFDSVGLTEITEAEMVALTTVAPVNNPKVEGEVYTLNGVDYQVPFMKDDADGLMQVNAAFGLGITDTVIHFTNGVKMPINVTEFKDFALWFVTKRNAFFIA